MSSSPKAREPTRSDFSRNFERRPCSENIYNYPSRVIPPEAYGRRGPSPSPGRSKQYSSLEPDMNRRLNRNDSASVKKQDAKGLTMSAAEEMRLRDVIFLRKMLAINKKQEMMLNKRLARLLEEEDFHNFAEGRERERYKTVVEPSVTSSAAEVQEVDLPSQSKSTIQNDESTHNMKSQEAAVTEEKSSMTERQEEEEVVKITPAKKVQYDINGRRIYYYSELEKDSLEECNKPPKRNYIKTSSSKRIESSKTAKKGSACSKKTFTMKKSLTYIGQSRAVQKTPVKTKRKTRKEDGDAPNCTNPETENPLDFELKPKKIDCQGDANQVQNVVVHCSTVFRNSSTSKKNIKVWNYESLPSLKSENSLGNKTVASDQRLQDLADCKNRNRPMGVKSNSFQSQAKYTSQVDKSTALETVFHVSSRFRAGRN